MELLIYGTKVMIVFLLTYFGARILTKKAIAEMTAYEIAGIMLLSNVAAEPLVTKVTMRAVFGTGLLIFLVWITSHLAIINKLTPIMEHSPTVVVRNGQLDMKALKATSLSLNQFISNEPLSLGPVTPSAVDHKKIKVSISCINKRQ